jgi:hypothetical protein
MGNPTGRIFFVEYVYRMILPDEYVPVVIPTLGPEQATKHELASPAAAQTDNDKLSSLASHKPHQAPKRRVVVA